MTAYRVTAPYVTVKVVDEITTKETIVGFYEGGILPSNVVKESAELLVKKGMVEKAKGVTAPPGSASTSTLEQSPTPTAPSGRASREEWATYATSKGAPAEETKPVDEGGLSRDDLRAKYGG
ncbi:hypothetical protein ABGB07_36145 [Micromonosporaceae bacterium B7E4]